MNDANESIGKSIIRMGAAERLRGIARFSADIPLKSPLVLKALRSPRDHARIGSIRPEKALALPGVVRVFTASDIPGKNLTGIMKKDQPLLAQDKVRSAGEAVALVSAETEEAAQAALDLIEVDYTDLPAVFDPEKALSPEAPRVHEGGNLLFRRCIRKGDPDHAFEGCAAVVEKTYRTSSVEHAYLEPDAGAGFVDDDGTLVIYASTQNPHYDHKEVVDLLGIPEERVRVIQAATGGGFGSKLDLNVQGFIGLALFHLKRPVRYVYSREEVFAATAKRHPLTITIKTGAEKSGRLKAVQARIVCDTGAYCSYGIAVAIRSAVLITGPYEVDHVDVESLCVYTNHPFSGAMRGFGTPQAAFAHESQLDLIAEKLRLDPLEIRRINALRVGSKTATGQLLSAGVGMEACLEAVRPHYEEALKTWRGGGSPLKRRGVGVGAMFYGIGNTGVQNPSTARIQMDPEGTVTLFTGSADMGQGSTTVLCQIAAEVLGISAWSIRSVVADTRWTTNAGATSASRQTYISGNAVKHAAEQLKEVLLTEAVDALKTPKADLTLSDHHVLDGRDPERRVHFSRLAKRAGRKGIPMEWQGYFDPVTTPLDPETGRGAPYAAYAFACQVALVEADVFTGEVTVSKIIAAHDVGKAIHPENVKGQICGGVAMGLGYALMEEFVPGRTRSLKDYHIPTCGDMPEIVPIIVESGEPTGPFGAKGVGEPALIPTAPAIVNGLADALGERVYHLPAGLERVLSASIRSGHFGPKEAQHV